MTLLGRPSERTSRLVHVLPLGITDLNILRDERREFKEESVDEWTVTDMTDQLVKLVENRQLVQLTVDTGMQEWRYSRLVNEREAEVMRRLEAAYDVAGGIVNRIVVK